MAARRKSVRKKASRKPARAPRKRNATRKRAPARAARRAAPKGPAGASVDAIARRIVRAASDPSFPFAELYAPDVVSREATGETFRGLAGLEQKGRNWEAMQTGAKWKARSIFVRPNQVCIEWEAKVTLRDGRTVDMHEIAVHDLRGGKIVAERYYYNPLQLASSPPAGMPS